MQRRAVAFFAILLALASLGIKAQDSTNSTQLSAVQADLQSGSVLGGSGSSCCSVSSSDSSGIITARPTAGGSGTDTATGLRKLGLSNSGRDGYLYVPESYKPGSPVPLIVTLHADSKGGLDGISHLYGFAKTNGVMLLAPESRSSDWDFIVSGSFGPDVAYINAALAAVFARYDVQQGSIGMEGFSDGASYAIMLGLANGDLFTKVIAFSPGGATAPSTSGQPSIFVSGGSSDPLFPLAKGPEAAACDLVQSGYTVAFVTFSGGHEVPYDVGQQALQWFLGKQSVPGPSSEQCQSSQGS